MAQAKMFWTLFTGTQQPSYHAKKKQPNLNTGFVYSVCSAWACVWYDNEGEFYHHMAYTQSAYIPALSDTSIVEIFSTATREKENNG